MYDIKDEILNDEPKYRIRDGNGNILYDNLTIEMITQVIQEPTPINKALLEKFMMPYSSSKYHEPIYTKVKEPIFEENCIPTLNANVTSDFSLSGTTDYTAWGNLPNAYYIFDSNYNNRYSSSITDLGSFARIEDGYLQIVSNNKYINPTKFKIYGRSYTSRASYAILQASTDGVIWQEIARTGNLIQSDTSFREESVNISTTKYYKYFRIVDSSSSSMHYIEFNKANISGNTIDTLDINRLDLEFGLEEYYHGLKLSFKTPDNLDERYTTKIQLDGLGYKDIKVSAGRYIDVMYNGTSFEPANIRCVTGTYTGNGSGARTMTLDFTPTAVVVECDNSTYGESALATLNTPRKGGGLSTSVALEITTNGFIVHTTSSQYSNYNQDGQKYNYIAFKEK